MKMLNENWLLNVAKEGLGLMGRDEDKGERDRIKKFMDDHKIPEDKYTINFDLSVSIEGDIEIKEKDLIDGHFPFKFEKVTGNFICSMCRLASLEGCPNEVGGKFKCANNKELKSLDGCPQIVGGDFECYNCRLKSLEHCPEKVNGFFICDDNELTSLKGCPKEVGRGFWCRNNELTSLEGCPNTVGWDFWCYDNTKQFTEDEVRQHCQVGMRIKVIKDENA